MVGEKEEEGPGLRRRRRSRAGRAANKLPEPLSGISRVCRRQGVIWFDFHNKSSSPEKASSKGTRDTCRRESHGAHGAADDTARCVGGLTAIRSASTKAPLVQRAFSISIMNLEAHRPATDEANETLAACGAHGRQGGVAPSASRAELREVSR